MIFGPTEHLSHTLQRNDTTVQEARSVALVTEAFLRKERTDDAFDWFYEAVLTASKDLTDEPVPPRRCKLPQHFDSGASSFQLATPRDLYHLKYFEALDTLCEEIRRQFDHNNLIFQETFLGFPSQK